jgi:hypothetical protein
MRKLTVFLLLFALAGPWLPAAASPDPTRIDKIKKQVADCVDQHRRVTIETYDDRILQGSISEARPDTFVLNSGAKSTTLNYAEVKKMKWPSPVAKQLKVALGATAIVGALFGLVALFGGLRD